jgi:hypothetical protein
MNVNYVMIMCCMTAGRGDVLKETMMDNERWWKGTGMVVLTSTKPIQYWFLLAQRPKQLSNPGMNYPLGS